MIYSMILLIIGQEVNFTKILERVEHDKIFH